jgi:uncharacterized protein
MTQVDHNRASDRQPGVDATLARHGGLSYLEIPALDPHRSAPFYASVLGWKVDWRSADDARFQDGAGLLIGRWVKGRPGCREPGLTPYFYVERIDEAVERAMAHGGEVARPPYPEGDLWVATVRDPAGNLIGLWQAGPR